MTSPTRSGTAARGSSYFAVSKSHRYSILFALPLLIGYEGLAAALARPGKGELRNGADALLRGLFVAVAGPRGTKIFMAAIILLGLPLHRPLRRPTAAAVVRFPNAEWTRVQRSLPDTRVWHHGLDARALRRLSVARVDKLAEPGYPVTSSRMISTTGLTS